jgi:hypothetical protein
MMKASGGGGVLPLMAWPGDFTGSVINSGPSILNLDLTADVGITEGAGDDTNPAILFGSGASGRSANVTNTNLDSALNGADYLEINAIISRSNLTGIHTLFSKWTYATDGQFGIEFESNTKIRVFIANSLTDSGSTSFTDFTVFVLANTEYALKVVYDGTLTNNDRIKVYIDDVLGTQTTTGTIPATLTVGCTSPFKLGNFGGILNRPFLGYMQNVTVTTTRP